MISPALDLPLCAHVFAQTGRLHLPDFLEPAAAEQLHRGLDEFADWQLTMNDADRVWDVPSRQFDTLPAEQHEPLRRELHQRASEGFQFLFKTTRISERGEVPAGHPLRAVAELVNSPAFLDAMRQITGDETIDYADAQATRYEPGHFLTRHDDAVPGKHRRAAYVLGLSRTWRAEWGGVLEFLDADGHVAEGYVPSFNSLNLLRVPQLHHVSCVAPFARQPRLSVTGWLRTDPERSPR